MRIFRAAQMIILSACIIGLCAGCNPTSMVEEVTFVKSYHTSGDMLSDGTWSTVVELKNGKRKTINGNRPYEKGEKFTYRWTEYN